MALFLAWEDVVALLSVADAFAFGKFPVLCCGSAETDQDSNELSA
jgi:hypothetical protein